jgi:hypothetical protein
MAGRGPRVNYRAWSSCAIDALSDVFACCGGHELGSVSDRDSAEVGYHMYDENRMTKSSFDLFLFRDANFLASSAPSSRLHLIIVARGEFRFSFHYFDRSTFQFSVATIVLH